MEMKDPPQPRTSLLAGPVQDNHEVKFNLVQKRRGYHSTMQTSERTRSHPEHQTRSEYQKGASCKTQSRRFPLVKFFQHRIHRPEGTKLQGKYPARPRLQGDGSPYFPIFMKLKNPLPAPLQLQGPLQGCLQLPGQRIRIKVHYSQVEPDWERSWGRSCHRRLQEE